MTARAALRCHDPRPGAAVRVVCFPHAGGTATFFGRWAAALPDHVELLAVQYPGREDRLHEPLADSVAELVSGLVAPLTSRLDGSRCVVFGHSLGAVVGYEVARELLRRGHPGPDRLVVSGRHAPDEHRASTVHLRDDDGVADELRRLGGTDAGVLGIPELWELVLPAIRGDFRLAADYRHGSGPALACPVSAVIGDADPEVDATAAARWAHHTSGPFDLTVLPGDHFYLVPQRSAVLSALTTWTGIEAAR